MKQSIILTKINPHIFIGLDDLHKKSFIYRMFDEVEKRILAVVCKEYNVSIDDIISHSRKREISLPRMIAMYFLRKKTLFTWKQISVLFSGRDHSTAINAYNTVEDLIFSTRSIKRKVEAIEDILKLTDMKR